MLGSLTSLLLLLPASGSVPPGGALEAYSIQEYAAVTHLKKLLDSNPWDFSALRGKDSSVKRAAGPEPV